MGWNAGKPGGECGCMPVSASLSRRSSRVLLLLCAVAIMSVADLILTLTYVRAVGLAEGNPIARYVMLYHSPGVLVAWKLVSVGGAIAVLFATRRHRVAELGAWVCFCLMAWLCFRWHSYVQDAHTLTPYLEALHKAEHSNWVAMTTDR